MAQPNNHQEPNFTHDPSFFNLLPSTEAFNYQPQEGYLPNDTNSTFFNLFPSTESTIPPFCTQDSLEGINLNVSINKNPQTKKKNEGWSNGEEELLMSAWVTISNDPMVGNGQQSRDFWRRITEYYNEFRKSFSPRIQSRVKGHWYQITPSINEFNQIFINIERQYHSGWSDDQLKDAARKLYYTTYKKSFKYEHAWAILKVEPKWNGGSSGDVHTKRRKTSSSTYTTSSDAQTSINVEDDEPEVRPMGKKKAIRKQKEKSTASNDEGNSVRDLINETNSLRLARIAAVADDIREIKESFSSSKRFKEIKILTENTEGMTNEQLMYHQMLCNEIKAKYGV